VAGLPALQAAIADYLGTSRGVRCAPAQVIVVSGVQEALDVVGRVLVDPGDRVCVEDPGYPGAVSVFTALGARIAPLTIDADGAAPPPTRLAPRLAYVTPAHQFPLGTAMSVARRLEFLEWAAATGAVIVEDDYDSEFRYHGRPIPAMQGLDHRGLVVYVGTFSKVLFPGLRLGYLVVPPDLVERVAAMKSVTHRHAPVAEQAVLADFMAEGHFGRHVRRMRQVYAERLGVLQEAARLELAGAMDVSPIDAGLQTVGFLREGTDVDAVVAAAAARQVELTPLGCYARRAAVPAGVVLGFAAPDEREIRRGVRELAAVLERAAGS
jgi:GntR family transcriptional regulator/MocR family aminotransferase